MKTQHTPGPWKLWTDGLGHVCIVGGKECRRTVCVVGPEEDSSTEIDAQMLVAAPELLEACKFALEWIVEMKKANPQAVHPKGWGMIELPVCSEDIT
jgi:hypothetical protein